MMKIKLVLILIICMSQGMLQAQSIARKAWIGILCSEHNHTLMIDSVIPNSSGELLGLRKGDQLISLNKINIESYQQLITLTSAWRSNEPIRAVYQRGDKIKNGVAISVARPMLNVTWCDVQYKYLEAIGCHVRSIIYKPIDKSNTPGILFIPGYNCGSIENFQQNFNGKMIEHWVKNGYTVYTVEKSGLGDSYGCKPCGEVDLQTDIELFETALKDLSSLEYIDRSNIFIWGHSMGGIIAPIIAQGKSIKGIMVFGTVYRPWSEFLLEMHRIQKPLTDSMTYEASEDFSRLIQQVYYEFFVLKKSPAQLHNNQKFARIVETELEYAPGKDDMWGRHWRFWQQLDSINLAKDWQSLSCKVLVLHGNADYIQCSAVEPYLITEAVNQLHPGNATKKMIDGIDHLMMNSLDFPQAVRNTNSKAYTKDNYNPILAEVTLQWMNELK